MESGGYMNKRVYNKTFGKIVRTLGFVLVLVSSLYIATSLIIENDTLPFINILTPFAQTADGFLSSVPIFSTSTVKETVSPCKAIVGFITNQ